MFKKNDSRNTNGFTLVELLIASAILGGIVLGVTELVRLNTVATKRFDHKIEFLQLSTSLINLFHKRSSCDQTLNTSIIDLDTSSTVNLSTIKTSNGGTFISSNSQYGNLNIGQISIKNIDLLSSTDGNINILVPVSTPTLNKVITIDVLIQIDALNTFIGCGPKINRSGGFDFSGNNRDGWICTCSEELGTSQDVVSTICLLEEAGQVTSSWKPYGCPRTCAGSHFSNGCPGSPPNPPGSLPVLRYTLARKSQTSLPHRTKFLCRDASNVWVDCSPP